MNIPRSPVRRARTGPTRLCAAVALSAVVGCAADDGLGRQAVRGAVDLDGKPLAAATVLFEPEDGGAGTAVGGIVCGGRFVIPQAEGPAPGRYRVRLYASSDRQAPAGPGNSPRTPRPMVELIPERYNGRSSLTAVVTKGGANAFAFRLSSDPVPSTSDVPGATDGRSASQGRP